ncbi:DNA repair protein RAD50 [Acorus calamus]|uniref:DNA repair protein RAD50 n=1 Tax=Acorus calamus TaxID=4465 RepID=A0AAV9BZS1_ACOCL|nr:DNA repair protein RAD50 [Acorus calamus]
MSTVDKMLIKGIRSFDPENKHVITFFRPLTLIVGPNGAGKTTIIECLKLSLTGELPPNTRSGQSFIHDPKVSGETETKAQIKLRFKTAARKDVVCVRSFQLTQKASKMEYKAIESVLQTINPNTGEKVCLSYRCADMDREIPALMGVSKAILENVIFVHQDESNWPLQDPSTLKKKFDDIFSATRYTKALEVIKKLHKDQAHEIKSYKLKLDHLQTLKDAAYKLRESIAQDQEKTESMKNQIQELERNIQNVENKILQTEATLKELQRIQEQISTKTAARSTLFNQQQKQYASLVEENEDTDEELKEWQNKFEERIAQLQYRINKQEREIKDTEVMSSLLQQTINDTVREIGKRQQEADVHLSERRERDLTFQRLFSVHNLGPLPNTPYTDEMAFNFTNRLKSRLMDLENNLQSKKRSNDMELKVLWDRYLAAENQCSVIKGQKQAKKETKVKFLERMKEIADELDHAELDLSSVDLSRLDEKEKALQIEVERKTHQLGDRDFDSKINQMRIEITSLDRKIKDLHREKDVIASDSADRVKLDLKKDSLEICKRRIKKIMDECKDKIRSVLKGRLPSDEHLKKEISHALGLYKKEYEDLNAKSIEAEKEVKLVQMKIEDVNNNISKFKKDMDSRRRFIDSKLQSTDQVSFDPDSFPKLVLEALEKRDVQKSKYNIADGMRQMFDPFERVARAHHMCPCCERPFSSEEEDEFVKKQRKKSASSAEHMKVLALESSNSESHFQQLDKLRILFEEYVKLAKETIPLAEENLQQLREDLNRKSQALDDIVGVLAHVKSEKDAVEALMDPVDAVDKLLLEMQNLHKQVDELEYKLNIRGQGVQSVEEIQSQLNTLQNKRDSFDRELENLREEQKYLIDDLSAIQNRWHMQREEKLKASNKLEMIKNAEKELARLTEEKAQLELEEKHLAETLASFQKEEEQTLKVHGETKLKLQREYDELNEIKRSYEQDIKMLEELSSKIRNYVDLRKGEMLKEAQEKHSLSESQLQKCDAKKQELLAELNKNKELSMNQAQLKRNIDDNLNYRKTKAEVDELTHEIELLEEQILQMGGVSMFEADRKRQLQEKERLQSELNRCHGSLSVYQNNISKHKLDLKQTQYNDIDRRYLNQLIQLKTTEMANKDLDRYYNALDKALMRFHTMKMEEINKIIRELWQQTYRGQDIDYISIHSDTEGAGSRSYSYRVLMQTGDAELEMRGRCSAGQKVLASIIIRLALAETFCLNCGILALDEPTTNLDGPNAESLAATLLRIMEDRKGQENFQLIVITHDERFAQLIGQRQHAEKYYRITKDEQQHSIIEAQEIYD